MRPVDGTVWATTIARAFCAARISSTCGSNVSGSMARPRYQSGPSSRAARLVVRRGPRLLEVRRQLAPDRRLIALHGIGATAGLMPPCRNTMPLIRTTAFSVRRIGPYGALRCERTDAARSCRGACSFSELIARSSAVDRFDAPVAHVPERPSTNALYSPGDDVPDSRPMSRIASWLPSRKCTRPPARRPRVRARGEVDHFARVRAAIDHVAELDEVRPAGRPAVAPVDDRPRPAGSRRMVIRAVHVADGDDPLDAFELARPPPARARRPAPTSEAKAMAKKRDAAWSPAGCAHRNPSQRDRHFQGAQLFSAVEFTFALHAQEAPCA